MKRWTIALAFILAVVMTLILLSGCDVNCPKGQTLQIVTFVPIDTGKTVVIDPIYECEK